MLPKLTRKIKALERIIMFFNKRVACVIPARLQSTRFPKKVLMSIQNKPILQWIWESASKIDLFDTIVFAVDAPETAALVDSFGAPYIMTSPHHPSGTDRLAEVAATGNIKADIWVNWQGDEPFIAEKMVRDLLGSKENTDAEIWTLRQRITDPAQISSPQFAKVVCDVNDNALFFSRSPIPFYRENDQEKIYYKHIGMYAFTTQALQKIAQMPASFLENAEKLEQLRWLQNRLSVKVHETDQFAFGIDFPDDLNKAEALLNNYKKDQQSI